MCIVIGNRFTYNIGELVTFLIRMNIFYIDIDMVTFYFSYLQ